MPLPPSPSLLCAPWRRINSQLLRHQAPSKKEWTSRQSRSRSVTPLLHTHRLIDCRLASVPRRPRLYSCFVPHCRVYSLRRADAIMFAFVLRDGYHQDGGRGRFKPTTHRAQRRGELPPAAISNAQPAHADAMIHARVGSQGALQVTKSLVGASPGTQTQHTSLGVLYELVC